ncbi:ParA family protein [Photobacterium damselae subsp. damselae]|uniref:ParA family protein n=1 Tax=Photobacterium damselae subsp. damselae TaxID=85581 RepID=A0A850QZE5_PHODD|nr:ParA family protein [Photobacterium damselae subsp. damselae]
MDAKQTLEVFDNLADILEKEIQRDIDTNIKSQNLIKDGDVRTYNKTEACSALGRIDPRSLPNLCKKIGIELGRRLNLHEINLLRDELYEKTRSKNVLDKAVVYAISNLKGGVGKTTVTATLATGLCTEIFDYKFRVAVLDLDPQGSLTSILLPNQSMSEVFTIGDLLNNNYTLDENESFDDFVYDCCLETQTDNLKIIPIKPSDRSYITNAITRQKEAEDKGEKYVAYYDLQRIVDSLSDKFDCILIDTPPNFEVLNLSAHYIADSVIVPIKPSEIDRMSTSKYFSFLRDVYRVLIDLGHTGYKHVNILPVDVDENSLSQERLAGKIKNVSTYNCFSTTNFSHSEAVNVCNEYHKTIFNYSPSEYPSTRKTIERIQSTANLLVVALAEQIINYKKK